MAENKHPSYISKVHLKNTATCVSTIARKLDTWMLFLLFEGDVYTHRVNYSSLISSSRFRYLVKDPSVVVCTRAIRDRYLLTRQILLCTLTYCDGTRCVPILSEYNRNPPWRALYYRHNIIAVTRFWRPLRSGRIVLVASGSVCGWAGCVQRAKQRSGY